MMRKVQFSAVGAPSVLSVITCEQPSTLAPSQLLIQNKFIGVNFIDTYHRSGLYKVTLPFTPGREASGIVSKSTSPDFQPGDRVAYILPSCAAEYAVVGSNRAVKLPSHLSLEEGAGLLLQGLTAVSLATVAYNVKKGDVVLIHASAGGTGQMLTQVCKYYGATVIGTCSTQEKAIVAKKAGVDHVVVYKEEGILEKVMEITGGRGVDCVFDGVGNDTFDVSRVCLKRLGFLLSFGNASGKVEDIDIMKLVPKAIRLMRPSLFQFITNDEDWAGLVGPLIKMVEEGKLKVNIHRVYPMESIAEAHMDIESGKTVGKLILSV